MKTSPSGKVTVFHRTGSGWLAASLASSWWKVETCADRLWQDLSWVGDDVVQRTSGATSLLRMHQKHGNDRKKVGKQHRIEIEQREEQQQQQQQHLFKDTHTDTHTPKKDITLDSFLLTLFGWSFVICSSFVYVCFASRVKSRYWIHGSSAV